MIDLRRVREMADARKSPLSRHIDFLASAESDLEAVEPLMAELEALADERELSDAPVIDYGSLFDRDVSKYADDRLVQVLLLIGPFEESFIGAIEQVRIHQEIEAMRRRVRGNTSDGRRVLGDRLLKVGADVWTFILRLCSLKDRVGVRYEIKGRVVAIGSKLVSSRDLDGGMQRVSVDKAKDSAESGDPIP